MAEQMTLVDLGTTAFIAAWVVVIACVAVEIARLVQRKKAQRKARRS